MQSIDAEEDARLQRFKAAWNAYDGDMAKPLKVTFGEPDDNIILPFVRSFVNTGVHFLFGDDLKMEGEDEKANEIVAKAWGGGYETGTQKMLTLNKLGLNGGITGQPFIKLNPKGDYTKITVIDPSYMSVRWDQEDIDEIIMYRIQWPIIAYSSAGVAVPAVRRQDIERTSDSSWTIIDSISKGSESKFVETGRTVWGFSFAPIVETQNLPKPNEYWGESDLDGGVLQINDALNSVISDVNKILRYHAGPKTVARGISASQFGAEVDAATNEMIFLPDKDQDLFNLKLDGDLKASMDTYKALKEALHSIASLPEIATGKVENIGQLSSRAMAILYKPLTDTTSVKRLSYGHLIDQTNRRCIEIKGGDPEEAPSITWPEILPRDALEERQVAESDLRMGITSKRTVAGKLGYDWEEEQAQMADETQSVADVAMQQFDKNQANGVVPGGNQPFDPNGDAKGNQSAGR